MIPRGYLSIFTTELRVHTTHLAFSLWDLPWYPRHGRSQGQSGLKGQARSGHGQRLPLSISSRLILNTIHRHFQKELHGMTSTNPPPQGKGRTAEEWADEGTAAMQTHRESLLSGGRLLQVTAPAMQTAQPAHLAELCAARGSNVQVSLGTSSSHKPQFHPSAIALE